jgi:hypothetical protein
LDLGGAGNLDLAIVPTFTGPGVRPDIRQLGPQQNAYGIGNFASFKISASRQQTESDKLLLQR